MIIGYYVTSTRARPGCRAQCHWHGRVSLPGPSQTTQQHWPLNAGGSTVCRCHHLTSRVRRPAVDSDSAARPESEFRAGAGAAPGSDRRYGPVPGTLARSPRPRESGDRTVPCTGGTMLVWYYGGEPEAGLGYSRELLAEN
eukprot:753816-Hanusia_phi.AAC.2